MLRPRNAKSILQLPAAVVLTLFALGGHVAQAGVVLVRDGVASAKIYIAAPILSDDEIAKADAARKTAPVDADTKAMSLTVRDLNEHIKLMSGTTLDIVVTQNPADVKTPALVLGNLAVKMGATPQKLSDSSEGYRLLVGKGLVLIGGQSESGATMGAYDLLRKLGCEWVMPGKIGQIVPQKKTVEVDDTDISSAPDYLLRRLWYRGYPERKPEEFVRLGEWMRRQKAGTYSPPQLQGSGGHVWGLFIQRHKEEFAKDPTMLALVRTPDGTLVRKGPQIEVTHPRCAELMAEEIRAEYKKNIAAGTWTKDTPAGFPIGPADGLGYSISPETMAISSGRSDPIGDLDHTDDVVFFANRILALLKPEFPNVSVSYYGYSVHGDFPVRTKPEPAVTMIYAPINYSRFHSLLDPTSKSQVYNKQIVEKWGALAKQQGNFLSYRGYSWNLAENMLPYTKVRIWGEELPFYKQNGFKALSVEGTKHWSILGPSDFVFMQLAWDTTGDWHALLHTYCEKAFGPAAKPMEAYFLRLIERQHGAGQEAGSYHAFPYIYDDAWIAESQKLIDEARKLAADDNLTRVNMFADNLQALVLYLQYFRAVNAFDFAGGKKMYDQMLAHWKKQYDANTDFVCTSAPSYLKRFMTSFVEQAAKLSAEPNHLVERLPDALPTLFDAHSFGETMQLYRPSINDAGWVRTHTFGSTWDAQGLGLMRSGSVWYRHKFTLNADMTGKPLGLFVGGVDDEVHVWLNGKPVGVGIGFSKPFVFDLTSTATQGENTLAFRIYRRSVANELGTGGIIRPSFIFTAPKIEPTQPATKQERVLPGGDAQPE